MSSVPKVAVVTGANKGIGFAIVKCLAPKFDGIVYLTARNEELGQKALKELSDAGLKNVRYHQLDIDNQQSIEQFAKYIKETYQGLDVLINNAAIQLDERSSRPFGDKAEETMRVNFTATLNVCDALFPLLRKNARVVNVASRAGLLKVIKNEDLKHKLSNPAATIADVVEVMDLFVKAAKEGNLERLGFPITEKAAYGVSKVGMIAATRIHQRLFDQSSRSDILINSCTPGYVATDMTSHLGTLTPEQGAETPIHLALIPEEANEPRGDFWAEMKPFDWFDKDFPTIV